MTSHKSFNVKGAIEVLERSPAVLRAMLDGLSYEWISGGSEESWAPFDIVGHLIHGEVTDWIPRAKIILRQSENRTFEPFNRFAQFELSKGKTLTDLLEEFECERSKSVNELKSMQLTADQLKLKGIHPEFGDVAMSELIAAWVAHDMTHIRQIAAFLAKKYTDEVGPWKEYLSILQ